LSSHLFHILEKRMRAGAVIRHTALLGEEWMVVERELVPQIARFFRDDPDAALDLLVDVTCLDHLDGADFSPPQPAESPEGESHPPRFEILYRFRSTRLAYRLLLSTFVTEEDPVVPSLLGLFPAALWLERELWDLHGIHPEGHPDMRRLILYGGFAGHPGRRDYPLQKSQPLVPLRMDGEGRKP
jgi:NADH-quinone oxidoreductase subunit C